MLARNTCAAPPLRQPWQVGVSGSLCLRRSPELEKELCTLGSCTEQQASVPNAHTQVPARCLRAEQALTFATRKSLILLLMVLCPSPPHGGCVLCAANQPTANLEWMRPTEDMELQHPQGRPFPAYCSSVLRETGLVLRESRSVHDTPVVLAAPRFETVISVA